jgi:hypothetical protein
VGGEEATGSVSATTIKQQLFYDGNKLFSSVYA